MIELLATCAPETVNTSNSKGNTPLHEAAYEGRVGNAAALLRFGADIEAVNATEARGGLTPLLAAIEYGHLPVVRLLLHEGADTEVAPLLARKSRLAPPPVGTAPTHRPDASNGGASTHNILSSGRKTATHRRINLVQNKRSHASEAFVLPGYGAISVALGAGQMHVTAELLSFLLAERGACPPIFTHEVRRDHAEIGRACGAASVAWACGRERGRAARGRAARGRVRAPPVTATRPEPSRPARALTVHVVPRPLLTC